MSTKTLPQGRSKFQEILVVCDQDTMSWKFLSNKLTQMGRDFVRISPEGSIRPSWERFKEAPAIIITWENLTRSGGAIIEEIIEIDPQYDVSEKIIVMVTNPRHEDVIYFDELRLSKIIRYRNRAEERGRAGADLERFIQGERKLSPIERQWKVLLKGISFLPENPPKERLEKLNRLMEKIATVEGETARMLDAKACLLFAGGDILGAEEHWKDALDKNPNYFRTYRNLVGYYRRMRRPGEALEILRKMQALNKNNISRLVKMGEVYLSMKDDTKAEHYFNAALDKDAFSGGALNGLADIRFRSGDLDETRRLLSLSNVGYKLASHLNKEGIELVKAHKYKEALDHYTKAQFVLPQQDKGPKLFYNIGLCYSRWGKISIAKEFLKIALVKEPNYKKAERLLEQLNGFESEAS